MFGIFAEKMQDLQQIRFQVHQRYQITPTQQRIFYTSTIALMDRARTLIASHPSMAAAAVVLFRLKFVSQAFNQMGLCRTVGAEIMDLRGAPLPINVAGELYSCNTKLDEVIQQLRDMLGTTQFDTDPIKVRVLQMIHTLAQNPTALVPWTLDQWYANFSAAIGVGTLRRTTRNPSVSDYSKKQLCFAPR